MTFNFLEYLKMKPSPSKEFIQTLQYLSEKGWNQDLSLNAQNFESYTKKPIFTISDDKENLPQLCFITTIDGIGINIVYVYKIHPHELIATVLNCSGYNEIIMKPKNLDIQQESSIIRSILESYLDQFHQVAIEVAKDSITKSLQDGYFVTFAKDSKYFSNDKIYNELESLIRNFQRDMVRKTIVDIIPIGHIKKEPSWKLFQKSLELPLKDLWPDMKLKSRYLIEEGLMFDQKRNYTLSKPSELDEAAQKAQVLMIYNNQVAHIEKLKILHKYYITEIRKNYADAGYSSEFIAKMNTPDVQPLIETYEIFNSYLSKSMTPLELCTVVLQQIEMLEGPLSQYSKSFWLNNERKDDYDKKKFSKFLNRCDGIAKENGIESCGYNSLRSSPPTHAMSISMIFKKLVEVSDPNDESYDAIRDASIRYHNLALKLDSDVKEMSDFLLIHKISEKIACGGKILKATSCFITDYIVKEVNEPKKDQKTRILVFSSMLVILKYANKWIYNSQIPILKSNLHNCEGNKFYISYYDDKGLQFRHFSTNSKEEKTNLTWHLYYLFSTENDVKLPLGQQLSLKDDDLFGENYAEIYYFYRILENTTQFGSADLQERRDVMCVVCDEGDNINELISTFGATYNVLLIVELSGDKFKYIHKVQQSCTDPAFASVSKYTASDYEWMDYATFKNQMLLTLKSAAFLKLNNSAFYSSNDCEVLERSIKQFVLAHQKMEPSVTLRRKITQKVVKGIMKTHQRAETSASRAYSLGRSFMNKPSATDTTSANTIFGATSNNLELWEPSSKINKYVKGFIALMKPSKQLSEDILLNNLLDILSNLSHTRIRYDKFEAEQRRKEVFNSLAKGKKYQHIGNYSTCIVLLGIGDFIDSYPELIFSNSLKMVIYQMFLSGFDCNTKILDDSMFPKQFIRDLNNHFSQLSTKLRTFSELFKSLHWAYNVNDIFRNELIQTFSKSLQIKYTGFDKEGRINDEMRKCMMIFLINHHERIFSKDYYLKSGYSGNSYTSATSQKNFSSSSDLHLPKLVEESEELSCEMNLPPLKDNYFITRPPHNNQLGRFDTKVSFSTLGRTLTERSNLAFEVKVDSLADIEEESTKSEESIIQAIERKPSAIDLKEEDIDTTIQDVLDSSIDSETENTMIITRNDDGVVVNSFQCQKNITEDQTSFYLPAASQNIQSEIECHQAGIKLVQEDIKVLEFKANLLNIDAPNDSATEKSVCSDCTQIDSPKVPEQDSEEAKSKELNETLVSLKKRLAVLIDIRETLKVEILRSVE
ncbi:hypothetical protein BC833DRAFT_582846, partial [Globomyces pollinis-pini]